MEAKPLKRIPEETTTQTTNKNITSDVPKMKPAKAKNSGRVASGKRLAERIRLAREAKKQAGTQKPPTNNTNSNQVTNNTTDQTTMTNNSTNTGYLILGVGGLIVSALGVYYQREAIMKTLG